MEDLENIKSRNFTAESRIDLTLITETLLLTKLLTYTFDTSGLTAISKGPYPTDTLITRALVAVLIKILLLLIFHYIVPFGKTATFQGPLFIFNGALTMLVFTYYRDITTIVVCHSLPHMFFRH